MDYSLLKSGTDIRGIASEGVEGQNVNLTDQAVYAMTKGFIKWLSDKTGKSSNNLTVAVGRDSRISGPRIIATALVRPLTALHFWPSILDHVQCK